MEPYVPKSKNLEMKKYQIRLVANDVPFVGEITQINVTEKFIKFKIEKSPNIGIRCDWQIICPGNFKTMGTGTLLNQEVIEEDGKSFKIMKIKLLQTNISDMEKIQKELIVLQQNFSNKVMEFRGEKE